MVKTKFMAICVILVVLCMCVEEEAETPSPTTTVAPTTPTITTLPPETKVISDPVIQRAEKYINKMVFDDIDLRAYAASIVSGCPSCDKECQINKIYRHIVENYKYYSDPRARDFIQSPSETIKVKGGDCEDLTILLMSLLENIGIKTYLVLAEHHVYCLACDVNTENLWQYIKESAAIQYAKDFNQRGQDRYAVIENDELFIVNETQSTFILKRNHLHYFGGDGSKISLPYKWMDIRYEISSSQPLSIYVVPSKADWDLMCEGHTFTHYPSCHHENILRIEDSCTHLETYGRLILENKSKNDATVYLSIKYYRYYSPYELTKNMKISNYTINGQKCIVLEPTGGKDGYPGYDAKLEGQKVAVDPITRERHKLQ